MSEQEKNEFVEDDSIEQDEELEYADVTIDALEDDDEFIVDVVDSDADAAEDTDEDVQEFIDEDEIADDAQGADATVDLDAQAEAMIRDIEAEGPFALRSHPDAEELDPTDIAPDADAEDEPLLDDADEEFAGEEDVDELPESIEIQEEYEEGSVDTYVDEYEDEQAERTRKRLRNTLIFFIIVLVILGAVIGVFIWKNSMSPDVKQSDSDALQTPSAGTHVTVFHPINGEGIPNLVSFFGMTPEEAAEASGNTLALDEASTPTEEGLAAAANAASSRSSRTTQQPQEQTAQDVAYYTRNGYLIGNGGEIVANFTFGLDKDGRIMEIRASFDMDSYGVADARFDELIADKTVAASMLKAVGVESATVDSAALSLKENSNAVTSRDTSGREQAEFSGGTNREEAPTTWKLTEVYDHTAGATTGDNSVIRLLVIELK